MKKNLKRIIFAGIAAGLCLSAYAVPTQKNKETVAAKCSKKTSPRAAAAAKTKNQKNAKSSVDDSPHPDKFFWPKKSAARKILEG